MHEGRCHHESGGGGSGSGRYEVIYRDSTQTVAFKKFHSFVIRSVVIRSSEPVTHSLVHSQTRNGAGTSVNIKWLKTMSQVRLLLVVLHALSTIHKPLLNERNLRKKSLLE